MTLFGGELFLFREKTLMNNCFSGNKYPYMSITYLNTLSRLSAPYLNSCTAYTTGLGNQPESSNRVEYSVTRELSAANQNRVLRHPSRQPIRIEHYVNRELSARVEVPSRLSAPVGSL